MRLRSANLNEFYGLLLSRQADLIIVYSAPDMVEGLSGDYLASSDIQPDRLIPVLRSDLAVTMRMGFVKAEMTIIAYPKDVFFGTIMADRILPSLGPDSAVLPKAETALTLAALEMAAAGVAVAWVPESLARVGIEQGRVADLSDVLPGCDRTARAVRLRGTRGQAEDIIWRHILALNEAE